MKFFQQHPAFTRAGVLLFLHVFCCGPAGAQQAMPPAPFATPPVIKTIATVDEKKATAEKTVATKAPANNQYLDTFLTLQRQNVLLGKLLERERSLVDMVQNYKKMGVEYAPPKPELSLCQEIPTNMACAVAYPDQYASFLPPPAPLPAVPVIPVAISVDELPKAVENLSADAGIKDLMWTDITCLRNLCRAVITPDATDPAARYSVKEGDALPPGGIVQRISSEGVIISHGPDTIILEPAPTRPFAMHGAAS